MLPTCRSYRRGQSQGGSGLIARVIDSSALAKFLLRERGWERVEGVLRGRPYSLEIAVKETANALWKRVVLLGDIGIERARILLDYLLELSEIALKIEPQRAYLQRALEIAIECEIPIYDALFLAQALAKKAELVTSDREQAEVASSLGIAHFLV